MTMLGIEFWYRWRRGARSAPWSNICGRTSTACRSESATCWTTPGFPVRAQIVDLPVAKLWTRKTRTKIRLWEVDDARSA